LAEGERSTGAQVAIAIFPSLEGESLEDYSIRLAQQWRIGRKGLDNGVILLVFVADRKVRMDIGYGLEAAIPDAVAGQIIRDVLAPRFREGRYARGLEDTAAAVFQRAASPGSEVGRPGAKREPPSTLPPALAIALFGILGALAVVIIMEAMSAHRFAQRNGYTAGRGGRWNRPLVWPPIIIGGGGRGGFGGWGGGGFSGGGGSFGGGGASGDW
jgi:uncharacterized protein